MNTINGSKTLEPNPHVLRDSFVLLLIIAGIVLDIHLWRYVYDQVSNSIPEPFTNQVEFHYPPPPKKIVLKAHVEEKSTGYACYALQAEDGTWCVVTKDIYDSYKLGTYTRCQGDGTAKSCTDFGTKLSPKVN